MYIIASASAPALQIYTTETKGQLISKCLFGATVSTKKPTNFFKNFSKKRSNQKNKGTLLY